MRFPDQEPVPKDRDFGGIYVKVPKETRHPKTIPELAETLAYYNERGVPVVIRNTGHSTNGQTVTDGVQIHLAGLSQVRFDKEKLLVHAQAGAPWHSVFDAIGLPDYCTKVFPNNPRQEIHIGGTASVGGVGFLSSKYGGFWNTVEALTLVTMEGHIVHCSRTEYPELFAFALGGYGRIGVIAEVTLPVKKTHSTLLGIALGYSSEERAYKDIEKAMTDPRISGISLGQHPLLHFEELPLNHAPCLMGLLIETKEDEDPETIFKEIRHEFGENLAGYVDFTEEREDVFDMHIGPRKHLVSRKDLVYWYPDEGLHGEGEINPWSDYWIPKNAYPQFVRESREIVKKSGSRKYLLPQRVNHYLTYHLDGSYVVPNKKRGTGVQPLGLGTMSEEYMYAYGLLLHMPKEEKDKAIALVDEVTDLCFKHGGIRYLYGIHNLTKAQVEAQYGKDTIALWQKIKSQTDPKGLLNRGVIEHLDEM